MKCRFLEPAAPPSSEMLLPLVNYVQTFIAAITIGDLILMRLQRSS